MTFCGWRLSLGTMFSRFIHVSQYVSILHPFYCWIIFHWVNERLSLYVDTYLLSLGYIPRSGMVESYDNCMLNCLRNCQTGFQSVCSKCMRVLIFQCSCQHLLLSDFFIVTTLEGRKWYFLVVGLISFSLMANDFEHFPCLYWSTVCMLHMLTGHLEVDRSEGCDEIQQNCGGIR